MCKHGIIMLTALHFLFVSNTRQQCAVNVTLGRVRAIIVAVEKQ